VLDLNFHEPLKAYYNVVKTPKNCFRVRHIRASPTVLEMRLQTVKYIAKKSKCAGLAQEIGFVHQICAAYGGW
jgi:hypothetical protein